MNTDEDELFNRAYFLNSCGEPYERTEVWYKQFEEIAARIIEDLNPSSVLDAGCAIGILVEVLRKRDIEATGFDISEYAISQVPDEFVPYIKLGSILDPNEFIKPVDLVVCIEVVEHLKPEEADQAIANLCKSTQMVLFSSTPDDFDEVTHFNVRPPGYWIEKFARNGFYKVFEYDASYVTPWAVLLRKDKPLLSALLSRYENENWLREKETKSLRSLAVKLQDQVFSLNEQMASQGVEHAEMVVKLQSQLEVAQQKLSTAEDKLLYFDKSIARRLVDRLRWVLYKIAPPHSRRRRLYFRVKLALASFIRRITQRS